MAKRIIECQVNDEYVVGAGVPIGASGSHDDVILRLKFNDTWDGLFIYATFRDALGGHPTVVLLFRSMLVDGKARTYDVTIPAAAKLYNGKATVTLTGYLTKQEQTEDGIERTAEASVTNTATAYFPVLPSNYVVADDGSVDPTLAQRLQGEIERHEKNVSEELEGIRADVGAEIEEHETQVAQTLAEHKTQVAQTLAEHEAKVAENLQAQDEEINGAVLTAAEAERIANEVKARADAGEFKGDPGKKGDKGDPGSIDFIIVTELPEEDIDESAIYLVPAENPSEDNKFIEYFYANGRWEMLPGGGINVDLTDYVKKTDVATSAGGSNPAGGNLGLTRYVAPYYGGLTVDKNGCIKVNNSSDPKAVRGTYTCQPITAECLNVFLIEAFAGDTYQLSLTDEEKAVALECLGVQQYVDNAIASITNGEEVAY